MARYHIRSAHTTEDCLGTLDQFVAQVPNDLPRWDFGCAVSDHSNHVAYVVVEASSEAAARESLPEGIRGQAQVTEVGKFTAAQVRSFHQ
jgi:hypothetical protein